MLPPQDHLFRIPRDVTYLNCAYTAPLMLAAASAGEGAIQQKSTPWEIRPEHFISAMAENRALFGSLIGTDHDNIAIIPAVSYGIALAARNLPVSQGRKIVLLRDQFPSNVYAWRRVAAERGARIITVDRGEDGGWTPAVLEAIDSDTAVAALPPCHWTDGSVIDLAAVGRRCREKGAALVVDGTQSLGAVPFSVEAVRPDFLVTTAHKWLLGPYGFGFCYVDPKWQEGVPLEENWLNREGSEDFARLVDYRDTYQPGARRYDVGEGSNFLLAPVAAAALTQILDWGVEEISETLDALISDIAARGRDLGFQTPPEGIRSPHVVGLTLPGGLPEGLGARLAQEKIFVSIRGDAVRVSPHLYNTPEEIDRFFQVLGKELR